MMSTDQQRRMAKHLVDHVREEDLALFLRVVQDFAVAGLNAKYIAEQDAKKASA